MSNKKSKIQLFDIFGKALIELHNKDNSLYSWPRNRISLTHALAMHLQTLIAPNDQDCNADLVAGLLKASNTLNPDILVHNIETNTQCLTVICRNDYLTEQEQALLQNYQKTSSCELVLALSFMPQKKYMLIYVANQDSIEYYHFKRNTLTIEPVRMRTIENKKEKSGQLTLDKIIKK